MKDYNFFSIYEKKRGIEINPKSSYFIGTIILLLCIAVSIGLIGRNIFLGYQIGKLTNELQGLKASNEYIEANQLQISLTSMADYDKNAEMALDKFNKYDYIDTDLMKSFNAALPSTTKLTSLYINYASINFNLDAPNRRLIAEAILNLKATGLFSNVHLESVDRNTETAGFNGSFICSLKEGEDK